MLINIEISVDKNLSLQTILSILYIDLDYYYIRFGRGFNHLEMRSKDDIIKYVDSLKNFSTVLNMIGRLVSSIKYGMSKILRYNLDYKNFELMTLLKSITSMFLM